MHPALCSCRGSAAASPVSLARPRCQLWSLAAYAGSGRPPRWGRAAGKQQQAVVRQHADLQTKIALNSADAGRGATTNANCYAVPTHLVLNPTDSHMAVGELEREQVAAGRELNRHQSSDGNRKVEPSHTRKQHSAMFHCANASLSTLLCVFP